MDLTASQSLYLAVGEREDRDRDETEWRADDLLRVSGGLMDGAGEDPKGSGKEEENFYENFFWNERFQILLERCVVLCEKGK